MTQSNISSTPTPSTFEELVKNFEGSDARLARHYAAGTDITSNHLQIDDYEEQTNSLSSAHSEAITALIKEPAPDARALAYKINVYATQQVADWADNHKFADILARDAARLAAN